MNCKFFTISTLIFFSSLVMYGQGWKSYLPQEEGLRIEFERITMVDTFYIVKGAERRAIPKRYVFYFTKTEGNMPLFFKISSRLGGADPDFNCYYPREPITQIGQKDSVTICFPGRMFTPPYVHTRSYIVNSNAENRDTLKIQRIFFWKEE